VTDSSVQSNEAAAAPTSLGLLERARGKDVTAWERLRQLYDPLVRYWCGLKKLQPADADDVRHDVFLAVLKYLDKFEYRTAGSFRRWLKAIADSKIVDCFRRQAGEDVGIGGSANLQAMLEHPESAPADTDATIIATERLLLYRRSLELIRLEFEDQTQQMFWRTVIDGAAPANVAVEFGTTVNAVYLAKSRILARLREEFVDPIER
jgi:RNA polymerase sigma-70 factor (ECF subfamily)